MDRWAHARLRALGDRGWRTSALELVVFVLKQAWACLFGALMLALLLAARFWYPDDAALARDDALTLAAVVLQVLMLLTRLETAREMRVVGLFHVVGTVMEVFKTSAGSWAYAADGVLRIGDVPLYSGFMYAAVGSYLVRTFRIFDLRFDRWPRRRVTALLATAVYANFFTHHWLPDVRWALVAAVLLVLGRTVMHYRVHARTWRMPVVVGFVLVASAIWVAENVATYADAWLYPSQADGWHLVSLSKLGSWFLLMLISVVLVAWVYRPQPPDARVPTVGSGRRAAEETGDRDPLTAPVLDAHDG
ncbi:DUF817 domain-containing protein [Cellulomonas shaoxiangyii]|uniref:DUF817 domain-containing protein n=1 Tax=Cellulomonas shaoxiangyii TaxID=2566013 RepID=A0A4P7SQG5_9CELL|nr:DUF817 domain-containing protein [Cellulomonas shaoxiangyii]TGY85353.1 DUF817 domain-containing protein [Cellulomonas shaoxiangyii]